MLILIPVSGDRFSVHRAFKQFQLIIFLADVWLDSGAGSVSAVRLPRAAIHLTKERPRTGRRLLPRSKGRRHVNCLRLRMSPYGSQAVSAGQQFLRWAVRLAPSAPAPQSIKCGKLSATALAGCKVQSHGSADLLVRSLKKAMEGDPIDGLATQQRAHR